MKHHRTLILAAMTSASIIAMSATASAQTAEPEDEVIAVGIRQSLSNALTEKRQASSLVEVIQSEDIGKLPDQNLAEVLENVTGIQITRTAGVGTGVQIRGTGNNNTLINGVETVGAGTGRGGISFEDVSAGIISSVEVIKSPEASTIEGAVGGTINLRTIRPLDLEDPLIFARIQGEKSSLSAEDSFTPRVSGTLGNKWENASGQEIGFVLSGSYTEQEATSFRPRLDRDGSLVENRDADVFRRNRSGDLVLEDQPTRRPVAQDFDFLGIQFLNQELENFEYDTTNVAFSVEAKPTNNVKLYFDAIYNDQERRQDSTRVQASGVSSVLNFNLPTGFETVNFGSLGGVNLGSIQAAVTGTIQPNLGVDDDDPNLRFNSDTGARLTDSRLYRLGTDWEKGNFSGNFEYSSTTSETTNPNLSAQLNFINPNPLTPLDGTSNDNSVPFIYDLRGDSLTFGIDFDSPFAPTVADLTNPNNVVLDQVDIGRNATENSNDAFTADISYDLSASDIGNFVTSVDAGYRYNERSTSFDQITNRIGGFSRLVNSPNGALFSDLLVAGPSNFGDADGRELAFRNFLIVDPDRAFEDQAGTIRILEQALIAHDPNYRPVTLDRNDASSFSIEETTDALYAQANFEYGMFRGNAGVRYVETETASTGNTIVDGVNTPVVSTGNYEFFLPRFNAVADVTDDIVVRAGWSKDINRNSFSDLNTSVNFGTNENTAVRIGNPNLQPSETESFDISASWYFAPSSVVSIGYFNKQRDGIVGSELVSAPLDANGLRSADPACPGGGLFNPSVQPNVLGDPDTRGLCVDFITRANDPESVTQTGIEMALQYDLSGWEDRMGGFGWASGFGVQANYTIQENEGGSLPYRSASRGTDVFNAINGIYNSDDFVRVEAVTGLEDFSENAYNITGYYEKYGLSARLRYTWREAFRTLDTAAGASLNSTLGFPVVTADRGQLNGSISYDVTDNFVVNLEAVNIGEEKVLQYCVNDGALLCAEGITDRRVVIGASYRY